MGGSTTATSEDPHNKSETTVSKLAKYVKENYFDKGVMDEVAIRAEMEAKQIPVTTADLTMAIERLRAGNKGAGTGGGTVPTVEQMRNQTDVPVDSPIVPPSSTDTSKDIPGQNETITSKSPTAPPTEQDKTTIPPPSNEDKIGDLVVPETVGAPPIRQIDDYIRQGYTNGQIEDILIADHLPRHRKLITDRRKMVESEVPDHGNKGAGTGGDAVPIITTPAIMGATPLIPPVNTGAGVGAINPQNTGNLGISHPTVTPIVPPIRTDADRVQTPNNETGTPTGTGASTSNPPKEQSIGEVITAQI